MRFGRLLTLIALSMSVSGCLNMVEPTIVYKDSNHPKSDTAVFAVDKQLVDEDGNVNGYILAVDYHSTRDRLAMADQNPPWVRVLPGTHSFEILYAKSNRQRMTKTVSVPNMQPKHVYVAHLVDLGMTYRLNIEDTGEHSAFKEHVRNSSVQSYQDVSASF